MKKLLLLTACSILLSISVIGCSNKTDNSTNSTTNTESSVVTSTDSSSNTDSSTKSDASSQTFTLEDLKQYNGQNGNPAYVAVDGTVYDVTNANGWKDGKHQSGIVAGEDLTDALSGSPHGDSVLEDLPVIGTLEQ